MVITWTDDNTTINTCQDKNDWSAINFANPDDNNSGSTTPVFREDTGCMGATAASNTSGSWSDTIAVDLTDKALVWWLWLSGPTEINKFGFFQVEVEDGAAFINYDFLPEMQTLDKGGWFPAVLWPTDDGSTIITSSGTIVISGIDTLTIRADNVDTGNDVKLVAWDFIHALGFIGAAADTVNLEDFALRDAAQNFGVVGQQGSTFQAQCILRYGGTGTTIITEANKTLTFRGANSDHPVGYRFNSGGTTDVALSDMVLNWTFAQPAFDFVAVPRRFRIEGSQFNGAGTIEIPAHSTSRGSIVAVPLAGGTGYSVNDTLTGVTGTGTKATYNVDAVSGGAVTAVSLVTEGDYTVDPSVPDTTTVAPAGGTGCTLLHLMRAYRDNISNKYTGCGEIDIGDGIFEGNTVSNAISGVLYTGTGTRRSKDNFYSNNADALHFDTAQTVTIDGDQFGGNDFDVHFSGTGTLTINATGGSNISTSRVSGGGTVVINNNVSVTLTGLKDSTEVRVYTANTTTELAGVENATDGTPDNRSVTFSLAASTLVDIRFANNQWIVPDRDAILDFTWPTNDSSIPITQVIDRSFNNP